MRNPKIAIPLLAMVMLALGIGVVFRGGGGPVIDRQETGILIAHAATGDQGCSKCHQQPVVGGCTSCHPSPPNPVRGIIFPHHDAASGNPITNCAMCHTGSDGDARFVKTVKATMDFCKQCHPIKHS